MCGKITKPSMQPKFAEGDVVIFSPADDVQNGDDCFVRLTMPHETTFKRVFFTDEKELRLQPRNNMPPPAHDRPHPCQRPLPRRHPLSDALNPYRVVCKTVLEPVDLGPYDTGDISVFNTIIHGF
jgi:hypothetical protein